MQDTRQESIKKLNELIKDIQTGMLTTIDGGVLRSRPMATQEADFDGTLFFLTGANTHKDEEIKKDNRVSVSYAEPSDNIYVSVSGTAETFHDQAKIDELWNPFYKAWFPEGQNDPNIRVLKVSVEQAEYWDSSSSTIVHLVGFLKALATGEQYDGGENKKIDL
ncbi:MAG: pyridoxamine 5'-phosphate oxidase family protein [Pyrinomonadaceae bacterium]